MFEWLIPGVTEPRVGNELTVDPAKVNDLSIYKCRSQNQLGFSPYEEKNLSELNIAACPSTLSLGMTGVIIGIIVIVVLIILAVVFFWAKKLFCFNRKGKGNPKQDYEIPTLDRYPGDIVSAGKNEYDYQPAPPRTKPPVVGEDSDDESDDGRPLVGKYQRPSPPKYRSVMIAIWQGTSSEHFKY